MKPISRNPWLFASFLLFAVSACQPRAEEAVESAAPPPPAVTSAPDSSPKMMLPVLQAAPAWSLPDLDGKAVSSSDFKGKVVVVDFWATWCPPCREEIPGYIALQKKYAADGLVIVGVSLDRGGPEVVKPFAAKMGVNYQLVMGDNDVVSDFGGFNAIPTTFLIDREGNVRHMKTGSMETADYEKLILAVLK